MEKLLISACLMGVKCKYSGGSNALPEETLGALREKFLLIPVCPETAGGLPTPRAPSERQGERVVSKLGADVTGQFEKGARIALRLAQMYGCETALMKSRSTSCGNGTVYDGSFSGRLVPGYGTEAEMLMAHGVRVINENETEKINKCK